MAFAGEGQVSGGVKNQRVAKKRVKKAAAPKPYTLPSTYKGDTKGNADRKKSANYQKAKAFSDNVQAAARTATPQARQKSVKLAESTAANKRSEAQKAILKLASTLGSEARDTKGNADRARADLYKKSDDFYKKVGQSKYEKAAAGKRGGALPLASLPTVNPSKIVDKTLLKSGITDSTKSSAAAIKVLNQLNRPTKASAEFVDKVSSGKDPITAAKAAGKAFATNKGKMYGDVLRDKGAPKWLAAAGGLVGDVALDPTTYVSFGATGVAKTAAVKAGEAATKTALKKGLEKEVAKKVGERKAKAVLNAAEKSGKTNKGLQVHVRGRVPLSNKSFDLATSGKTTAAISRATGISKLATKVRNSNVVQSAGEDLVHDFRPAYLSEGQHKALTAAERQYRAEVFQGQQRALRRKTAIQKAEKKTSDRKLPFKKKASGSSDLIKQIETRKSVSELSPAARDINAVNEKIFKAEKNAGLRANKLKEGGPGDPVRYFPHVKKKESVVGGLVKQSTPIKKSSSSMNVDIAKQRKHTGTLESKVASGNKYETDAGKALASRESSSAEALAKANLIKKVAATGRTIRTGSPVKLHEGEELFRVSAGKLQKLPRGEAIAAVKDGTVKGNVVAMDPRIVARTESRLGPSFSDRSLPGRAWDKTNSKWKTIAMATPGFHIRNLIGDGTQSLTAGTSVRDFATSAKGLKVAHKVAKDERSTIAGALTPKTIKAGNRTVKIGKEKVSVKQLYDEAVKSGAVDSGYAVREIDQLGGKSGKTGSIQQLGRSRENLARFATYINGRRRGLDSAGAADLANKHHFDYGDLTKFERGARRAVPFYTFAARNARLQAGKLVKEPGRMARVPKALEEAARAQGYESYDEFVSSLPKTDQEGVPIPIGKKGTKNAKAGFVQLPQQDLRRLNPDVKSQGRDIGMMISPVAKTPAELLANHSLFYGDKISDPSKRPFSPAPSWLKNAPESVKKKLGVSYYTDKRRGRILGWKPTADYIARSLGPQVSAAVDLTIPAKNNRGLDKTGRLTSMFGGIKLTNVSDRNVDANILNLSEKLSKIDEKKAKLKAQGKDRKGEYYTNEYAKLLDAYKKIKKARDDLKKKRGDIVDDPKNRAKRRGGSGSGGVSVGVGSSYGSGGSYGGSGYGAGSSYGP